MKKMNFKSIFIPTFSLFLICLIVAVLLSLTNTITKDKIKENEEKNKQDSMITVCPDATNFMEIEKDVSYLGTDDKNNPVGYAISTSANGYGGVINVMTGFDMNGDIIAVDVFYNDDETPGLGKNTSSEDFTNQFNKKFREENGMPPLNINTNIVVKKDSIGNGQEVDAVTSATISSRAVVAAVNDAVHIYTDIQGGEIDG